MRWRSGQSIYIKGVVTQTEHCLGVGGPKRRIRLKAKKGKGEIGCEEQRPVSEAE